MTGQVFLVSNEGHFVEMRGQAYGTEDELQTLLEQYPKIMAGDLVDSVNPRRWLLVSREMGVPDGGSNADRWSIDHLFIDQDGIPTFVEVKRSSDTRIRREVIGQMLDYAANAVANWPVAKLRSSFEARAGDLAESELMELLRDERTIEDFWQAVRINLEAGCVRLVFVSDAIPNELRTVIEFLYRHMDPVIVLGVEVPQYFDQQTGMRTIVPRLIGPTAQSLAKREAGSSQRNRSGVMSIQAFFDMLVATFPELVKHIEHFLESTREMGIFAEPATQSMGFKWRAPSGKSFNLGAVGLDGRLKTYAVGWAPRSIGRVELAHEYLAALAAIVGGQVKQTPKEDQWYVVGKDGKEPELLGFLKNPKPWISVIQSYIKKLEAMTHRP